MKKFKIQTLNHISSVGLQRLPMERYDISSDLNDPDAILLRSHSLHDESLPDSLMAIGRAGAGVNNVPVDAMTERGIPVFNTPGANANAVKELVLAGLIIASRNICQAWDYVKQLDVADSDLPKLIESGKKQFAGSEIQGRTLGVIGLGAIGVRVANSAVALGMNVIGYDPVISVKQAWQLQAGVKQAQTLDQLLAQSDFITIHVPLNDKTRGMLDSNRMAVMKKNTVLLNFSRGPIVDETALVDALEQKKLRAYINDFPNNTLRDHSQVISLPHLGASTEESQDNCAVMVVNQIRDYLELGTIEHSVNFPGVDMPWRDGYRLCIVNKNIPNMVGQISTILAEHHFNVLDLINKSRDTIAYTLIDVDQKIGETVIQQLQGILGVIHVRVIENREH